MSKIQEAYERLLTEPTDMMAHIAILRECAAGKRVVEFGCRRGVSTMAMLAGRPLSLTTYDLDRTEDVGIMEGMAEAEGLTFKFVQGDIHALKEVPPCDFAFVDFMHNGDSVGPAIRFLARAGCQKIAFHDTEIFGRHGDVAGTPGILDAIDAFLAEHADWRISYHTDECFGFTIIEKTS